MKRAVLNALLASLNDPSAGWEFSEYEAINRRIQCSIWIANSYYGLSVKFWGEKIQAGTREYSAAVEYENNHLGFWIPWRHRLYNAAYRQQQAYVAKKAVTVETLVAAIQSASEAA